MQKWSVMVVCTAYILDKPGLVKAQVTISLAHYGRYLDCLTYSGHGQTFV